MALETWMRERVPPFTVVVDAPNVAYCRQNYEDGCFSFGQVQVLVEELTRRGEEVLVMMPTKYTDKIIPNHIRQSKTGAKWVQQTVSEEEEDLVKGWEAEDRLYRVPRTHNDDWYWIFASLIDRSDLGVVNAGGVDSSDGLEGTEGPEGSEEAEGTNMVVVTNDQVRERERATHTLEL